VKKAGCPKLWQVEALRDHKLTGKLQIEASNHIEDCATCKQESLALALLQHQLQAGVPLDALALRRLRVATLTRANEQLHRDRPARVAWLVWVKLAAPICALVIVLAAWLRWRQSTVHPNIQLRASNDAVWTRNSKPGIEYVDLVDGMLDLAVARSARDPRLIVRVPDGEVEDMGTEFRVRVSGGQTREVGVESGSIVFRRTNGDAIFLSAGSTWRTTEDAPPLPAAPPSLTPPSVAPSGVPPARASATTTIFRRPKQAPLPEPSPESGATDEDLAFLRIVALLHDGRDAEARLAARDYLRRYPDGFRRVEVLKLLESTPRKARAE
jgi:hypothetical protein